MHAVAGDSPRTATARSRGGTGPARGIEGQCRDLARRWLCCTALLGILSHRESDHYTRRTPMATVQEVSELTSRPPPSRPSPPRAAGGASYNQLADGEESLELDQMRGSHVGEDTFRTTDRQLRLHWTIPVNAFEEAVRLHSHTVLVPFPALHRCLGWLLSIERVAPGSDGDDDDFEIDRLRGKTAEPSKLCRLLQLFQVAIGFTHLYLVPTSEALRAQLVEPNNMLYITAWLQCCSLWAFLPMLTALVTALSRRGQMHLLGAGCAKISQPAAKGLYHSFRFLAFWSTGIPIIGMWYIVQAQMFLPEDTRWQTRVVHSSMGAFFAVICPIYFFGWWASMRECTTCT